MKLAELMTTLEPLSVEGSLEAEITGITCDSRRVLPGNLFVAVRGYRADGHEFVERAIDRGAAAVMFERETGFNPRATRIRVADTRRTMALASAQFFGHPSHQLKVIGVTGTNGKTTTAFLVKAILEGAGLPAGLMGTVRYEIGPRVIPAVRTTPESIEIQAMMSQMVRAGCAAVSMEVSSHALELHRVDGVDFDVAIFTNLSPEHLDYHRTMEDYFQAKARLFSALGTLRKAGRSVVNVDSDYGRRLIERLGGDHSVLTYGMSNGAQVRARQVRVSAQGSEFLAETPQGAVRISVPLIGRFNVSNALAAMAAGLALGIEPTAIRQALAAAGPVPGRLEAVEIDEPFCVYVDYAHTEQALRQALSTVAEFTTGRVLVVFGCGGDRDRTKRAPMGWAACELADFAILTSDNPRREDPRAILREIEAGYLAGTHGNYDVIVDRREAIERALDLARPGDAVLIAGKGHESYQEFADSVVPFNDREVIEEYYQDFRTGWTRCA